MIDSVEQKRRVHVSTATPGVTWSETAKGRTYEARDPASRKFVSVTGGYDDAVALRAKLVATHKNHEVHGDPSTKVKALVTHFEEYHSGKVTPQTWAKYLGVLKKHVLPKWGERKAREVTKLGIEAWLPDVPVMAGVVLSLLLDVAVNDGIVPRNVYADVKKPKREKTREGYAMTEAEFEAVRTACSDSLRDVVDVALGEALRLGEVAGLDWEDVDFSGKRLTVSRQLYADGTTGLPKHVKREKDVKTILLTSRASAVLARRHLAAGRPASGSVFGLSYRSVDEMFRRAVKRTSVEFGGSVTFHSLRHTGISRMANGGFALKAVSVFARHATVAMTEKYVHEVTDDARDDAMREVV
jgi:integrase